MSPAKKIGYIHIKELDKEVKIDKLRNEYGLYEGDNFNGIRYYSLEEKSKQYLLKKFLPKNLCDKFEVLLMMINCDNILPHTDSDIRTVINYYIKGSDAVTYFWKLKNKDNVGSKLDNQTDGAIYDVNDLNCFYSFKAQNNELWILNVKEIHSVLGTDGIRIAFCFQTELEYTDILNKINF